MQPSMHSYSGLDFDYSAAYQRSLDEPEEFWEEIGRSSLIHWDKTFEKALDNSNPPFTKWFVGGYLNACYNCVDRHVLAGNGSKVAIIHDSPLTNTIRKISYQELYDTSARIAGGLQKIGVKKGDRVVIYMPLIPEGMMAMLATVRIGAVHSVVFGGFAANELCNRIEHAKPKVIIAANCAAEPNKIVRYLDILDDALSMSEWKPLCNVIYQRESIMISPLNLENSVSWNTFLAHSEPCDCVPVEANDPLYLLYTSGTTNKPKGIQRPTGGHLVSLAYSFPMTLGVNSSDVWWAASDLGWVVGHSYICYGPLLLGATTIMYEGKPDRTPDPGQFFRVIDQYKVTGLFAVPSAFRAIRRIDPEAKFGRAYNIDSLRGIFTGGEISDLDTLNWVEKIFRVPALNHYWQTENGSSVTSSVFGLNHHLKPMLSTGLPYIGHKIDVFLPDGTKAAPNELGRVAVKLPLPPGNMSTLYKNDDFFKKTYFERFPMYFDTMDAGFIDENGYVYITGRDDDVINVAGHRISTSALEDAVLRNPNVGDAAVFGVPEQTKGEVPLCLYIMNDRTDRSSTKIDVELIRIIREVIGPVASFRLVAPVTAFPRTRSGKVLRKVMADFARNKQIILPGTIEDPSVFVGIREALQKLGFARTAPDPITTRK